MKHIFYTNQTCYYNEGRNCMCQVNHERFDTHHKCEPNCYDSSKCSKVIANRENYEVDLNIRKSTNCSFSSGMAGFTLLSGDYGSSSSGIANGSVSGLSEYSESGCGLVDSFLNKEESYTKTVSSEIGNFLPSGFSDSKHCTTGYGISDSSGQKRTK